MTVGREVATVRKANIFACGIITAFRCHKIVMHLPFCGEFAREISTKEEVLFFMRKEFLQTKKMVMVALLIALNVVIVRFLSVQTETIRISFGFLPTALCSMMFGPWVGALAAFLSDFLGMIVNSKGLSYFPGFGISEALYGLTYGLFLYKHSKKFSLIIPCVLIQTIIIDLGLGTFWLWILFKNPVWLILGSRTISALVMFPIKIFGIKYIWELVGVRFVSKKLN